MKKMGDFLLRKDSFSEIVMGNTALVRAMIETKTKIITSYPGSPTPEIASAIKSIPKKNRAFHFEFSVNEKVATEVAYGASVNGHLSTVFFKSVGLNVAADIFIQLSMMNVIGGMIIILGDDPGANSSQNEQDNRHYALMSYVPMFEPSDPQEAYIYYKKAVDLSLKYAIPVVLRMTTHVCHAKQKVYFNSCLAGDNNNISKFDPSNGPYIPITTRSIELKRKTLEKIRSLTQYIPKLNLNTLIENGSTKRGIIVAGLPYLSVQENIFKISDKPNILKLGCIYPIVKDHILSFLLKHDEVKVIEELDNILEKEIKSIAFDAGLKIKIYGKSDLEDSIGEYTPDKVAETLMKTWPDIFAKHISQPETSFSTPLRPAQMCPGCGHRSAFFAVKQALGETDITIADIGCHTMGFMPPYEMGQLLMCMGASVGIASGLSIFNNQRKIVAFMGDSTFFHASIPGVLNSIYNNYNITMIVMENGTTAMTGHQEHPGTGKNFDGTTNKVSIEKTLETLGVKHIYSVDTYQQKKLTNLVKQATLTSEFSVIIAKHPCMLKFTKTQRKRKNYEKKYISVENSLCNKSYTCVEDFCCPSISKNQYDGSIEINTDICIGDSSCAQTCPSKAINLPDKK